MPQVTQELLARPSSSRSQLALPPSSLLMALQAWHFVIFATHAAHVAPSPHGLQAPSSMPGGAVPLKSHLLSMALASFVGTKLVALGSPVAVRAQPFRSAMLLIAPRPFAQPRNDFNIVSYALPERLASESAHLSPGVALMSTGS